MKTIKTIFFTALSFLALMGIARAQATHYTAHEWGTFTGLSGSDGTPLNGLYVEEEQLPIFVHNIGGRFPKVPYDFGKGTPVDVELSNVNIKMETPVIYFYSKNAFTADVKVQFTHGLIGQWFPDDSAGVSSIFANNFGPTLDFGDKNAPVSNFLQWNAKIMPMSTDPKMVLKSGETHTWTAPRATDANIVQAKGESEKFLFYRGIGNFDVPVKVSFDSKANLVIQNNYTDAIPYFFVYDKADNGDTKVWFSGAIAANTSKTVPHTSVILNATAFSLKLMEFQAALTAAGLYDKESAAMLNTWQTSYFGKPGLRVFWIVPRKFTDGILPITMNPAPDAFERVLIGRSEIMTPVQEQKLYNYYKTDNTLAQFSGDRFIEAYKERMAYLDSHPTALQEVNDKAAASSGIAQTFSNSPSIMLYPNPAKSSVSVTLENTDHGNINLSVVDLSGKTVMNFRDNIKGSFYQRNLDISLLSNGIYFIKVQTDKQTYTSKMVKE